MKHTEFEYKLADEIRKAFLKHGNNSWVTIATEVSPICIELAKGAYNAGWFGKGLGDHPKDFEGWLDQYQEFKSDYNKV